MDLSQGWRREFSFVDVRTQAQRAEAFKLRHQVFVQETGWHPAVNGMELDHYDFQSVHGLVHRTPTQRPVGTARLILADPHDPSALLPAERFLPGRVSTLAGVDRSRVAEMSRFAVVPEFRKRELSPMLGLIAWQVWTGARLGLTYWCAVMEPRLVRGLQQFGICLNPLSQPVEDHGTCRVYGQLFSEFVNNIKVARPECWALLTNDGQIRFDG